MPAPVRSRSTARRPAASARGLGIDGFGAGLGSTLGTSAAPEIFGSLGAWGTAAVTAADLTFAGQGIAIGSSLASTVQQAASTVADALPSSTSAAAAPAAAAPTALAPAAVDAAVGAGGWTLPSAGSILSGIGSAAGLVGSVAGAAGAVGNLVAGGKGAPASSSGTATAAQHAAAERSRTWLLILAGAAGVYLVSRK